MASISGTNGNDVLNGTSADDIILGLLGNDTISDPGGFNRIDGQDGNDTINGGANLDYIAGGPGDDLIHGGAGNDQIIGEAGNDTIYTDDGNDYAAGNPGDDILYGAAGNDFLVGEAGRDQVFGEAGNDFVAGGDDDDLVDGGAGDDLVDGDLGNDNLIGGAGNDTVFGDFGDDRMSGGSGNDIIDGGVGFDTAAFTTRFADTLLLQGGATTIFSGPEGVDTLTNVDQLQFSDISIGFRPDVYGSVQTGTSSAGVQVAGLFDGILGRAVDTNGLISFTDLLKNGGSIAQAADAILHSSEYTARFGAVDAETNSGFVNELYQTALGRAPDQGGFDAAVSALNNGASRAQIAANIALSQENFSGLTVDEAGIFVPDAEASAAGRLYFGLLDRPGDAAGVLNFKTFLESGGTTTQAAQAFINSSEYQTKFAGLSNADFIDQLYENTLGRDPDASGFDTYTTALNNGTSRADVAVAITQSTEAQHHLAPVLEQGWVTV